ncbi:hypothetical protein FOPG_09408 [Fusarium oxysporum f. sp. conglutinans race 2 54008]|uniref:Uncharacterized protein n=1 Tax=Fusarium oxysporum f. sp. conglutinans race 2 54008 TaxID=1089457 RepID=X0HUJ7_FUSOX|nr:hypothetical protein FOPG_09408 [Fusarium oxysporum f. sp. conglutinans race 2 54008]
MNLDTERSAGDTYPRAGKCGASARGHRRRQQLARPSSKADSRFAFALRSVTSSERITSKQFNPRPETGPPSDLDKRIYTREMDPDDHLGSAPSPAFAVVCTSPLAIIASSDIPDDVDDDYVNSEIVGLYGPHLKVRNAPTDPCPGRRTVLGRSALSIACANGSIKLVDVLKKGPDVKVADNAG